jgi:hypothetical protein
MGQREAIAFGEGVATTMRMKFEKVELKFIPGTKDTVETAGEEDGSDDVDLAGIIGRMRNIGGPAEPPGGNLGEPMPPRLQAGDDGFRKPAISVPAEPSDLNYGRPPGDMSWRFSGRQK